LLDSDGARMRESHTFENRWNCPANKFYRIGNLLTSSTIVSSFFFLLSFFVCFFVVFSSRLQTQKRGRGNKKVKIRLSRNTENSCLSNFMVLMVRLLASALIYGLFLVVWFSDCLKLRAILELNWFERLREKSINVKCCRQVLTSSTQLQNRSFHVVERTKTTAKCTKMKNVGAKRPKLLFFVAK